jgi:endonuclease/exonuclease/phosphatase family metal-dependent hydrolase
MRIVSWNAKGADAGKMQQLAQQLRDEEIDVCVLQEAHAQADNWYAPLQNLNGYELEPALPENQPRNTSAGQLAPAGGKNDAYAVVWKTATVALRGAPYLLDYTTDGYWGPRMPSNKFGMEEKGYNQRPPLVIPITYQGANAMVFTWHAPQDHWNTMSLDMFGRSQELADAGTMPTVIAGDLNTKSVSGDFQGFVGLQQKNSKLDYILANTDLSKVTEIPGVSISGREHWAIAAEVRW